MGERRDECTQHPSTPADAGQGTAADGAERGRSRACPRCDRRCFADAVFHPWNRRNTWIPTCTKISCRWPHRSVGRPSYFIRFLDEACASHHRFGPTSSGATSCWGWRRGQRVLEVGCGTGDDARDIAAVGPPARSSGWTTVRRWSGGARAGLRAVEFHVGDAAMTTPPAFDAVRARFMHIPDPVKALAGDGTSRARRPVLVDEVDFETVTIDTSGARCARRRRTPGAMASRDGWLRRHARNVRDAGLWTSPSYHDARAAPMLTHQIIGSQTVERAKSAARYRCPGPRLAAAFWTRRSDRDDSSARSPGSSFAAKHYRGARSDFTSESQCVGNLPTFSPSC